MEVLGLCSYPVEAAATRFRFTQFVAPLAEKGINLTVNSFLNSEEFASFYKSGGIFRKTFGMFNPLIKCFLKSFSAKKFDVLLVQREAMMFGPPVFEWLTKTIGQCPLVLDLDDATYIRYLSPTYGRLGSALKFFGKTDSLIKWSEAVICGNRFIAEYVDSKGTKAVVIPTVVDTKIYHPLKKSNEIPVIGWIGTHSTFEVLKSFFPVLQRLARNYRFIFRVVGAGINEIEIDGVEVQNLSWSLEREVSDFQTLDIGLYPITTTTSMTADWILAKSGFKAIQYMAVGVPFVMSPVGICAEMGEPATTHFNAANAEDWYNFLERLLKNEEMRNIMGAAGREYFLKHYELSHHAERLAEVIRSVHLGTAARI